MELTIFGCQLSRGTFVNEKTGENFPYDSVKFKVLATLTTPRQNYVGNEVADMVGAGDLWEKRVQPMANKFPGKFNVELGQKVRNGRIETIVTDIQPIASAK